MVSYRHATRRITWRKIHRSPLFDISQFILLVVLILWFFTHSTSQLGYNWQWYQVPQYIIKITDEGIRLGPLGEGLMRPGRE